MIEEYKSETGVDKWIRENVFTDIEYKGLFVEVGAATPELISNSYHYRINGWRTISIEPNPKFVKLHKLAGSEVYQYACSDEDNNNGLFVVVGTDENPDGITYHSFSHLSDNSLIDKAIADDWVQAYTVTNKKEIKIKVRKLDTILKELNITHIDILTIDVEGNEMKVLNGIDFNTHRPTVIVLENIGGYFNFIQILEQYGYEFKAKLGEYDEVYMLKK
jgi:FkbM family methyltransferase